MSTSGLARGRGGDRPLQKQKFTYPAVITGQGHSQHARGKAQHNRCSFNVGKWTRSLVSREDLLPRHGAVTHPAAWGAQGTIGPGTGLVGRDTLCPTLSQLPAGVPTYPKTSFLPPLLFILIWLHQIFPMVLRSEHAHSAGYSAGRKQRREKKTSVLGK